MLSDYDIIVVGAGHAGCEAACAGANLGSSVLLITMDMTKIAQMSCNPAMGGIAKGQIIREIDALGGYSGIVTEESMIQFRMLNRSKGPAMWSPRAQCDRQLFSIKWRELLERNKNIDLWQDSVTDLMITSSKVYGVKTGCGTTFRGKAVIITTGTFGNGLIHIGRVKMKGGRISEPASYGITEQLKKYGFECDRMKTGTPPRIDGRTVDFEKLEEQKGDKEGGKFSFLTKEPIVTNNSCFITYTNEKTHRILEKGFKDSPLYNGTINSIGPRYCPSIEDKIVTFASKDQHQLFLEPEGSNTVEYYVNGFASSLPWNIQYEALRSIKRMENVKIFRPGYAIEYDFYQPYQLYNTLETKRIENLYLAGQVNGTTGYEEAAGQGIIAGINAHLKINRKEEFILGRDESYIGVLVDDLITKGVDEPYRMFTSRAEFRILLRQDNADERLTEKSYSIGLANNMRYNILKKKVQKKKELLKRLKEVSIIPERINSYLEKRNTTKLNQSIKLYELISRPQIELSDIIKYIGLSNDYSNNNYSNDILHSIETDIKYEGYREREKILAEKVKRLEEVKIKSNFDFKGLKSISTEGRQKLNRIKPETIGQASRIPGVSPADINVLLAYLGR
jgi:tRNA uridine 5-carboxymethylaminomethyl modification enzyme